MRSTFAAAAVIATANALVARDTPVCCFGLSATGNVTGAVGQIDDGQVRLGSGLSPGQFCIDASGAIKDGNGRGCFLTRMSCTSIKHESYFKRCFKQELANVIPQLQRQLHNSSVMRARARYPVSL